MVRPAFLFLLNTLCAFTLWSSQTDSEILSQSAEVLVENEGLSVENNELSIESVETFIESAELLAESQRILTENKEDVVETVSPPMRAGLRYTTPDGIGYKQGYTTIEGFFSSIYWNKWLGFLDVRGHVFDNGKLAANAGVGARRLSSSRIWGVNAYYDYRNTDHQHYNQVAVGLESLGKVWDVRLNGYLPVGNKESPLRHTHFDHFHEHHIYLQSTRDFALKGANLEGGVHVGRYKSAELYVAGGPYYLNGKGATAWGGELRGVVDFFDGYFRLEANTSYDSFFHWIGQGQISINIPLGKQRKIQCPKRSCSQKKTMYARGMQRVDRNEIITVGTYKPQTKAINPVTKKPYYVVFVDNTSSSFGTFESPYSSLAAAQANSAPNDIIYVFPGDDTSTNMDAGITLQDGQMFLGASTVHPISTTLGGVFIPTFASTIPVITNTSGDVVTLANNNLVSGLYIENFNGAGISGTSINNFTATQNTIVGGQELNGEGIFLNNVIGQMVINDNLFAQTAPSSGENYAVHIVQSNAQCSASLANNMFYLFPDIIDDMFPLAIFADLSLSGIIETLNISNNVFVNRNSEFSGDAILAQLKDNSSISNLIVSNCSAEHVSAGLEVDLEGTGSITNVSVLNTSFVAGQNGILVNLSNTGSITNLTVSDCNISNNNAYGLNANLTDAGSITDLKILACNFDSNSNASVVPSGGIFTQLTSTGGITHFTISGSSITNTAVLPSSNTRYGIQADISGTGIIQNLKVISSNLNYNSIAVGTTSAGSIGFCKIANCNIIGSVDNGIFVNNGTISELQVLNNRFNANVAACNISPLSSINGTIVDNTFNVSGNPFELISGAPPLQITISSGNAVLSVSNNSMSTPVFTANGYAASISTSGGALCLDFVHNKAMPVNLGAGIDPYLFNNGGGTFNLTAESTQANNIGTISTTGAPIGSCTQ